MINFTGMSTKQKLEAVFGFMTAALAIMVFAIIAMAPQLLSKKDADRLFPRYVPEEETGLMVAPRLDDTGVVVMGLAFCVVPAILICVGAYFHARHQRAWGFLLLGLFTVVHTFALGFGLFAPGFFGLDPLFTFDTLLGVAGVLYIAELSLGILAFIFGWRSQDLSNISLEIGSKFNN